jgi:hypothetical protein
MATERGVTGRDKQVDVDLPPRRAGSEWTELTLDRGRVALTTSVSQLPRPGQAPVQANEKVRNMRHRGV